MFSEWIVAVERGLKGDEGSGAIHVHPTYSTVSTQAAAAPRA